MTANLCLGTVQFGTNYGVTNKFGKVTPNAVENILSKAVEGGISFLDTAQGYGDAEEILGKFSNYSHKLKIINKLQIKKKGNWSSIDLNDWELSLSASLKKLKLKKIDTLLVHQFEDLCRPDSEILLDWLCELKNKNIINRIGVSIYDVDNIAKISLNKLDVIQLPLSIYDQRFLKNNTIKKLVSKGISVHVRSIFLQGLILQNYKKWPSFLSSKFKSHHKFFLEELNRLDINALEASISFIKNCAGVELVVFGVTSCEELELILKTWDKSDNKLCKNLFQNNVSWSWDNKSDIDPRSWPAK